MARGPGTGKAGLGPEAGLAQWELTILVFFIFQEVIFLQVDCLLSNFLQGSKLGQIFKIQQFWQDSAATSSPLDPFSCMFAPEIRFVG